MKKPKVLILGGGFGGLNAAKSLKDSDFDVWLVDRTNFHLFQPLLYQVASAALSPGDIAVPIREILRSSHNITVIMAEVVAIDAPNNQVKLENGEILVYDYLIGALGARHSYFGHEDWEALAPGLKTLSDALDIRERILLSFELAERCPDRKKADQYLNFAIVGGGPTGVEMAGAIAEISRKSLLRNFRRIDPSHTNVYLIESLDAILPSYPRPLSLKAEKYLADLGVKVIKNQRVTAISKDKIVLGDTEISTHNVFWAAGNTASQVLKTLNVPLDRQGRVIVENDLSVPGFPNAFIIGDAACTKGFPLPPVAPAAVQQGRYVAKLLKAKLAGKSTKPFRYLDKGTMATIGKSKAVAMMGSLYFSGLLAWLAWCFVHIMYLVGFRNRFAVFTKWFVSYFSNSRSARLIYRSLEKNSSFRAKI